MEYRPLPDAPAEVRMIAGAPGGAGSVREYPFPSARNPFDVMRRFIPNIPIGQTGYPLRTPVQGTFFPPSWKGEGEFYVEGFKPAFVGRGPTSEKAFRDWCEQVHCRFQELYVMRPFEMTEAERADWQRLEERIDVAAYREHTPITVRQTGKVAQARPRPCLIKWTDGSKEKVRLEQMPDEFASYKPGQPFEAVVKRHPVTYELLEVTDIRRTQPLPRLTDDEFQEFWDSLPTTKSLPAAAPD